MEEIWKDIKGYEGYYQVSNLGRVRSLDRIIPHKKNIQQKRNGYIMKLIVNKRGYSRIGLLKFGKQIYKSVHRLVAEAFLENESNFPIVMHIVESMPLLNNVGNLKWGTHKENRIDTFLKGRDNIVKGEKHHFFGKPSINYGKKGVLNHLYGKKGATFGRKGEFAGRSKIVLNLQTGIYYYGVESAANTIGENTKRLRNMLLNIIKNRTPFIYA